MKLFKFKNGMPEWLFGPIFVILIISISIGITFVLFECVERYRAEELPPGYKIVSNGIGFDFVCNHPNCFNIETNSTCHYRDIRNAIRGAAQHAGTDKTSREKKEREEFIKNHGIKVIEIEPGKKY